MLDMLACFSSEMQTALVEGLHWLHDQAQICLDLLLASCSGAGPMSGSALTPSELDTGRARQAYFEDALNPGLLVEASAAGTSAGISRSSSADSKNSRSSLTSASDMPSAGTGLYLRR